MARAEWTDPVIQEGLMLDANDHVIEGTMTNLFYIKNNSLYTAALAQTGVAGIMRSIIMTISAEHGLAVIEHVFTKAELLSRMKYSFATRLLVSGRSGKLKRCIFSVGPLTQGIQAG